MLTTATSSYNDTVRPKKQDDDNAQINKKQTSHHSIGDFLFHSPWDRPIVSSPPGSHRPHGTRLVSRSSEHLLSSFEIDQSRGRPSDTTPRRWERFCSPTRTSSQINDSMRYDLRWLTREFDGERDIRSSQLKAIVKFGRRSETFMGYVRVRPGSSCCHLVRMSINPNFRVFFNAHIDAGTVCY